MHSLVLAVALAAAPGQVKLASPGLAGINVTKEVATFYSDHLAQQLALQGNQVMTSTEISSLLGLERQKQLLGCSSEETAACMAELANALGVEAIVTGSIGRFDTTYQLDVKVVSSTDGRKLALYSGSVKSERDVLDALSAAATSLDEQLKVSTGRAPAGGVSASSGGARRFWWVPAAVGVLGLGVGVVMMVLVGGNERAIKNASTYDDAYSALQAGNTNQTVGIVALSVGGAALLAAGALYLFGAPAAVTPVVTGSGGGLSFAMRWP